jgi:phospholipid transport system substrate-binding protein
MHTGVATGSTFRYSSAIFLCPAKILMLTRIHPFIAIMLLLIVTAGNAATSQGPTGPMATVKAASDRILSILSDPAVSRKERWTQIAPVISESFDFLTMSKSVLSRRWPSAKPYQQRQFVDFFSQYIEGTYRTKIEAYSGQRIDYIGEKVRGERASVDSVIRTDNADIPVSYYLRLDSEGNWKAYDVTIEGVSLVNNYREIYAAIAKTSGMEGVLARVKQARERVMDKTTVAPGTQ